MTHNHGRPELDQLIKSMDVLGQEKVEEDEIEGNVQNFETMIALMKKMKERSAHLPDAERKAAAEQVAMKMLAAMGSDSDNDDNDGED